MAHRLGLLSAAVQDERQKAFAGEIAALHSARIRPALNLKGGGVGGCLQGVACCYLWRELHKLKLCVLQALTQEEEKKYRSAIMHEDEMSSDGFFSSTYSSVSFIRSKTKNLENTA